MNMQPNFLMHWLVSGLAVFLTAKLTPSFEIRGFFTACLAALLIGFANAVLWPILIVLTLPINILTLGLFTLVVNGAIIKICAGLLKGFEVKTWFAAIWGSILLSIVSVVLRYFIF